MNTSLIPEVAHRVFLAPSFQGLIESVCCLGAVIIAIVGGIISAIITFFKRRRLS